MRIKLTAVMAVCAAAMATRVPTAHAESGWLEPEEGTFAGYTGPDSYELLLRHAMLEDDHYRGCQLLRLPAFGQESVVYIVDRAGSLTVVNRTMKEELWGRIQRDIQGTAKERSSDRAAVQAGAFDAVRSAVDTKTAPIDRASANTILDACREVLLGTRYAAEPTRGNDGVSYHAGHWMSGTFLAGQTWSPKAGTIAREFVDMEEALAAYAAAVPSKRDTLKSAVLNRATLLLRRVRVPSATVPANPALNPTGLRPAG